MGNRYEGNVTDHINLVCKECHAIIDYKIPVAIDSREVTRKTRFRVTDTRLEYYGYCQKCRKKLSRHSTQSILKGVRRQKKGRIFFTNLLGIIPNYKGGSDVSYLKNT
jgi:ribosomal protein L33